MPKCLRFSIVLTLAAMWPILLSSEFASAQQPITIDALGPVALAFSPNGKLLAVGAGDQVILFDVALQRVTGSLKGGVQSLSFSADSKVLATVTVNAGGSVKLWRMATRTEITEVQDAKHKPLSVLFSPDGKSFATGGQDGKVKIWDTESQKEIAVLEGVNGPVTCLAVWAGKAPVLGELGGTLIEKGTGTSSEKSGSKSVTQPQKDGPFLIAGGTQKQDGFIKIWEFPSRKDKAAFKGPVWRNLAFFPDGKKLLSGPPPTIWDIAMEEDPLTLESSDTAIILAMSPDGKTVAMPINDFVGVYSVETKKRIAVSAEKHDTQIFSMAFSPDGKMVASGSARNVKLWEISKFTKDKQ